jgi:hypothetical protein
MIRAGPSASTRVDKTRRSITRRSLGRRVLTGNGDLESGRTLEVPPQVRPITGAERNGVADRIAVRHSEVDGEFDLIAFELASRVLCPKWRLGRAWGGTTGTASTSRSA